MIKCPKCSGATELQKQTCSHCGTTLEWTVAEKFDMLAQSVETALKKEMAIRRLKRNHQ